MVAIRKEEKLFDEPTKDGQLIDRSLYKKYGPEIHGYFCTELHDNEEANRASKAVFIRFANTKKKIQEQQEVGNELAQLQSIARDVCYTFKLRKKFKEQHELHTYNDCLDRLSNNKGDAEEATQAVCDRFVRASKSKEGIGNVSIWLNSTAKDVCEDIVLVKKVKEDGNKDAYGRLFIKYQKEIYKKCHFLLLRRNNPRADAEEATQEAFMKCYEKIYNLRKNSSFYYFLRTTALRLCINTHKIPEVRLDEGDDDAD